VGAQQGFRPARANGNVLLDERHDATPGLGCAQRQRFAIAGNPIDGQNAHARMLGPAQWGATTSPEIEHQDLDPIDGLLRE
jgi:hypothetical protein